MIPVITVLGPQLMLLIGGTVIIEQIFMIPGMGRLFVEGIFQRDYPIISSVSLILSSVLLLINLGIDVSYAFLDPRIRYR